jgi:hypothetical protein
VESVSRPSRMAYVSRTELLSDIKMSFKLYYDWMRHFKSTNSGSDLDVYVGPTL